MLVVVGRLVYNFLDCGLIFYAFELFAVGL